MESESSAASAGLGQEGSRNAICAKYERACTFTGQSCVTSCFVFDSQDEDSSPKKVSIQEQAVGESQATTPQSAQVGEVKETGEGKGIVILFESWCPTISLHHNVMAPK